MRNKIFRHTSLTFVSLCLYMLALSQTNSAIKNIQIASPNAASLGKFGDVPVSLHTGIPEISIPIYKIKSGSLEMPISLSYHAGGLKVMENASWVGAGWALNAGGVITRTVMGAPDDLGLYHAATDRGHFSDYGYNSYLFSDGPATCAAPPTVCAQGRSGMPANNKAPQDSEFPTAKYDGESDLYFFNFNGYTGKFYFNDDRTPMIIPEMDLKITTLYPGNDWRGITGFIITTPDGTKYYFGINPTVSDGDIDATEETYNATTQNTYVGQGATSAWYLIRVESADQQSVIRLSYKTENYSYYTLNMFPIPSVRNPDFFAYNVEYDLDKNFIDGVRLDKIFFNNGEVDFNAGNLRQDMMWGNSLTSLVDNPNTNANVGARALGDISIVSTDLCKKFKFYTSYFVDNISGMPGYFSGPSWSGYDFNSDKYRLKLDSIQESSCNSVQINPPYKFTYNSGFVPRKLHFGIDHWGFYNGITTNSTLIPTYTITPDGQIAQMQTITGADRDTHWPYSLGGTLEKITYPTAGSTAFNYESNSVYTSNTVTSMAYRLNLVAHLFGQGEDSMDGTFTSNGNPGHLDFNNTSAWSAYYSITNSTTHVVTYSTIIGNNSAFSIDIPLPAGNYSANVHFTSYSGTGGISAYLTQSETNVVVGTLAVGGLRIRSIVNTDDITGTTNTKTYRYTFDNTDNGQVSGVLFSRPIYVQAIRNDAWGIVDNLKCSSIGCLNCFGSTAAYYQSPASIRPMRTSMGNHIGYGEVFVSESGNGYTENRFYSNNGSFVHIYDAPVNDVCVRSVSAFCDPGLPNSPAPPDP